MKIEFGCGEKPTKVGFKTCDIRNLPGIDFVCTAWEIDQLVAPDSVDEIFSRHFFEHLTFRQGERLLGIWHKILKPAAVMEMILPNMLFHIDQWLNHRHTDKQFKHSKAGFWGWQRDSENNNLWDLHKSGYDFDSLSELLESKNFKEIQSLEPPGSKHLHIRCVKK